MWEFIIPAVASLAGSLFSSSGQRSANEANVGQAQATNEFNAQQADIQRTWSAEQAQKSMDFSQQMSNTQWQRGVEDMRAAGLNPMLAYSQGGASSPAGSQGSSSSASGVTARVENEMGAFSSAGSIAQQLATLERTQAETAKIKAETETEAFRPETQRLTNQEMTERIQQIQRTGQLTDDQIVKVRQEVLNLKEDQGIKAAEMMLKRLELLVKDAETPRDVNHAIAEAKAWGSEYGQNARPYVHDLGAGTSSANQVRRLFRGGR